MIQKQKYSKAQKALNQINKITSVTVESNQELDCSHTSIVSTLVKEEKESLYSQIKSYYSQIKSIKLVDCPVGDGGCFIDIVETGMYGYEDEFSFTEYDMECIEEKLMELGEEAFILAKLNQVYKKLCLDNFKEFKPIESIKDCINQISFYASFNIKQFLLDSIDCYVSQEAIDKINDFTDCKIFNAMTYKNLYSPNYYNFSSDYWYCDLEINPSELVRALDFYKVSVEYLESLCSSRSGWYGMDVRIWDIAFLSFGLTSWLRENKGYEELRVCDWYYDTDYSNYVEFGGLVYQAFNEIYHLLRK
jgi:hypothetical protein